MYFGLALEIFKDLRAKASLIHSVGDTCKKVLSDNSYSGGIDNLYVGIILTMAGEDPLHPIRPFKFQKRLIVRTSPPREIFNSVFYDIKPDYEFVRTHDGEELRHYLCSQIYESTEILSLHTKKYPTFDLRSFRADLRKLLD